MDDKVVPDADDALGRMPGFPPDPGEDGDEEAPWELEDFRGSTRKGG